MVMILITVNLPPTDGGRMTRRLKMNRKFRTGRLSAVYAFAFAALFSLTAFSCKDLFQGKIPMDTDCDDASLADLFSGDLELKELPVPEQVTASKGWYSKDIMLSWTPIQYARSYCIERAVVKEPDADGNWHYPDVSEFETLVKDWYGGNVYTDKILSSPSFNNSEYGWRFYYRIQAKNLRKGLESEFSGEDTEGCGWLLAPPSKCEADKGKSVSSISVSWNKVPDAAAYLVFRSSTEDFSSYEKIGEVLGNTLSFSDTIPKADQGLEKYYKIKAKHSKGGESEFSGLVMGYTLKDGAPSSPSNLHVLKPDAEEISKLDIAWNPVPAPDGSTVTYSVYRTSSVDSVYTKLKAKLASSSYTDTSVKPGIKYYYYVQTCVEKSGETLVSAFSDTGPESENPVAGILLSPPSKVETEDSEYSNSVNLVWSPSIGTAEGISFVYTVYSSQSENGTYTPVAGFVDITGDDHGDGKLFCEIPKYDYYKISSKKESNGTLESALSPAAAPLPDSPENVRATKTLVLDSKWTGLSGDGEANQFGVYPVRITWNHPAEGAPAGYNVYRSAKLDASSFVKINESLVTECSYIDRNATAKPGVYYYYKVVSVNSLGQGKKGNDPASDSAHDSWGYGALTTDQWFREYNTTVLSSQKKLTLMHNPDDRKKLGSETVNGTISGTLGYNAQIAGLGAEITMPYSNYADFYINSNSTLGVYFCLTGNTDTTSNMSGNGNMHGTVTCTGMYPGEVGYGGLQIKGGAAGGGYYMVKTKSLDGAVLFSNNVDYLIGEENK